MGDWPCMVDGIYGASAAIQATAAVGVNTKGNYTELFATAARNGSGLLLNINSSNFGHDFLVDVAVGGAGSEVVLAANLGFQHYSNRNQHCIMLPIAIAAGQRLACRCQSTVTVGAANILASLVSQGILAGAPFGNIETLGATVADSGGTSVDPGAVVSTKGAWVQFAAASSFPYRALMLIVGEQRNVARANATWWIDIAVGAALSEIVVIPDLKVGAHATYSVTVCSPHIFGPLPITIPAGTRIAVRSACDINDATDRLLDCTLYGFG